MKKFISICLCISLLCGCVGVRGLQRQSTQKLHKTIKENNEMYWNNEEGHTSDVKMVVRDKYHAQIEIPIVYTEDIEKYPQKLPETTARLLQSIDLSSKWICNGCVLNDNNLTIPLEFSEITCGPLIFANILVFPLTIAIALTDFQWLSEQYKQACISTLQNSSEIIGVTESWMGYSLAELHENGVNATIQTIPESMRVVCNKKSCQVLDREDKLVNRVVIHKNISFDKTKIKKLLIQEEQEKRKLRQKQRQKQRQREEECPYLYRAFYRAQQGGYLDDPIFEAKINRRFLELGCQLWVQDQINQSMY